MKLSLLAAVACLVGLPYVASAQSVVTYHNAPDRSGAYTMPGLTVAAAGKLHLDSHFSGTISGNVYAQPLYWKPAGATTGLLIVATESNLVYALNANTGAQVWKTQLMPSAPQSSLQCGNIDPEGVTGTPVIDPASGTLYLDALTLQGGAAKQVIYALSLTNGAVLPSWPLDVETAMAKRNAAFASNIEGERSALQFFQGKLYVSYAGRYGDCGDYHGIVVEFDPTKPSITGSWETRAQGGGIWSQGGVSSDGVSLFATTGNTFGASDWEDGEAVIRLRQGLAHSAATKDNFTPHDWKMLDDQDRDLGGTGAVPFTVQSGSTTVPRVLALGKDGHAYLLNSSNLGAVPLSNAQISNSVILTAPAVFQAQSGTLVALTNFNGSRSNCSGNNLTMLKVTANAKSPLTVSWCAPLNGSGSPILTTTDGASNNPIFWVVGAEGDGLLHGFNAFSGKEVSTGSGSSMNGVRRFGTLIAANRHLYVAADGTVYAFTY